MSYVLKRDGRREEVQLNKVQERIENLSHDLDKKFIDVAEIARKTVEGLYDGIRTTELDDLSARICASMATRHPEFGVLAARVAASNIHKNTEESFSKVVETLHSHVDKITGKYSPMISDELFRISRKYEREINEKIDYSRDLDNFDYFGLMTLKKNYLGSIEGSVVERPQHMFMRVALGIHGEDIKSAFETYDLMSNKYFTHATPTLFNAGTPKPQLSSCFLLSMTEDSIEGIYETLSRCAKISQFAGGIGLSVHNVRAKGSYIAGSRGFSSGLLPMLRNFNETARYVDQGGGKRKGAFNIYLEPHHADIFEFLDVRSNRGAEELRARDLFISLWISDLFMERVKSDDEWSLFCPNSANGLCDVHGEDYKRLYEKYEAEGRAIKTIKARDLWFKIVDSQIETGTPFMLYKDAANRKSNQKNLGTIRSSNLCTEIIEFTDKNQVAVCNLASICLNRFVKEDGTYDFEKLHEVTKVVTKNLNKVIDINFYPVKEADFSNKSNRPIGIGVQGLADTFAMMKLSFDEPDARTLNKQIFETIYHAAVETSMEISKEDGPYKTFRGSPMSEGKFQFDLWNEVVDSGMYDWEKLRDDVMTYGIRNSLLLAPMPTASTAHIFGNMEAFEPFTSNLYVRRVSSGEFVFINKHLLKELIELDLWNDNVRDKLIEDRGSIQNIDEIPLDVRKRYRTVWEMPQKSIVDMAADRGAFICQSQSLNIHMKSANQKKLTSLHFYAWERGLKTGMYYLRNTPSVEAVQFTVDKSKVKKMERKGEEKKAPVNVHTDDNPDICLSCGS